MWVAQRLMCLSCASCCQAAAGGGGQLPPACSVACPPLCGRRQLCGHTVPAAAAAAGVRVQARRAAPGHSVAAAQKHAAERGAQPGARWHPTDVRRGARLPPWPAGRVAPPGRAAEPRLGALRGEPRLPCSAPGPKHPHTLGDCAARRSTARSRTSCYSAAPRASTSCPLQRSEAPQPQRQATAATFCYPPCRSTFPMCIYPILLSPTLAPLAAPPLSIN